jgi:hypothetical protein
VVEKIDQKTSAIIRFSGREKLDLHTLKNSPSRGTFRYQKLSKKKKEK